MPWHAAQQRRGALTNGRTRRRSEIDSARENRHPLLMRSGRAFLSKMTISVWLPMLAGSCDHSRRWFQELREREVPGQCLKRAEAGEVERLSQHGQGIRLQTRPVLAVQLRGVPAEP